MLKGYSNRGRRPRTPVNLDMIVPNERSTKEYILMIFIVRALIGGKNKQQEEGINFFVENRRVDLDY